MSKKEKGLHKGEFIEVCLGWEDAQKALGSNLHQRIQLSQGTNSFYLNPSPPGVIRVIQKNKLTHEKVNC